jgi:hypothetical protein
MAATGGVAKFNNKMRLVGQNSNFYKMNNSYKRNEVTGWKAQSLNIYNAEGVFKQILVGYMDGQLTRTMLLDGTSFNSNQYFFIVFVKVKFGDTS